MSASDTKQLTLSSDFEEMDQLEPFVDELQQWASFGEEDLNRIMLALSEAVNNAVVHGNKQDPEKEVVIDSRLTDNGETLVISVEDEGDGFDPNSIPDPLKEENLLKEGGRGVYLIKQYADEVQFSKKGTKITITFSLD